MVDTNIIEVRESGEVIHELVQRIEPVLVGHSRATCVIAMISMVLSLQFPEISPEERQDGVKEISQYICMWLSNKGIEPTGMVN